MKSGANFRERNVIRENVEAGFTDDASIDQMSREMRIQRHVIANWVNHFAPDDEPDEEIEEDEEDEE